MTEQPISPQPSPFPHNDFSKDWEAAIGTQPFELPQAVRAANGIVDHLLELKEQATIDPLTGLYNRRVLTEEYGRLQTATHSKQQRSQDIGDQVEHSIFVLDIDNFKIINDGEGGHAAGDAALKELAQVLLTNIRHNDLATRLGGDEVAVLLFRIGPEKAMEIAEKVRKAVELTGRMKISIGLSTVDLHKNLDEMLHQADKALYTAKHQGRNQVVRFEDLETV